MTNFFRGTAGWALLTTLLALAGCNDDSPPEGTGGSSGTAGRVTGGTAGASGTGGARGGTGGTNAGADGEGAEAGSDDGGADNRGGTSGSGGNPRGGSGNDGTGGSSAGEGATGGTGGSEGGHAGDGAGGSEAGTGGEAGVVDGGPCAAIACPEGAECHAEGATASCTCSSGWNTTSIEPLVCEDIDECATANGGCDALAECTNGPGTRWCVCPPGYRGDGLTCALIDPCPCENGGKCVEFKGSVVCDCVPGTSGPTCELSTTRLVTTGGGSCSLMTDGSVRCWGTYAGAPHAAPLPPFVDISGYGGLTCGLTASGERHCWSSDSEPALFGTDIVSLAGDCALHTDGQLLCPNQSVNAQFNRLRPLGAGGDMTWTIHADGWVSSWGEKPGPSRPVKAFAVGRAVGALGHSCTIEADDTIRCEGNNDAGQASPPAGTFVALTLGRRHGCARTFDQTVQCWGDNTYGQSTPPAGTFTQISAGDDHTCGVRPGYKLECWGRNDSGQTSVDTINTYFSVAGGGAHTCGRRTDLEVKCWGNNDYGQADAPASFGGPQKVTEVVAGARHSCAIDGSNLRCWGDNSRGQAPAFVNSYGWLSAGREHTCAVDPSYTVHCWGNGDAGQTTPRFQPTDLKAMDVATAGAGIRLDGTVRSVDSLAPAGTFKSITSKCGIGLDDTVRCWYADPHPPGGTFTSISSSANSNFYCGLHPDGLAECWNATGADDPILHPPAETFTQISAGTDFACGLRANGTVRCWGNDRNPGATPPTGVFRRVAFDSAGYCAIHSSGSVSCWESGNYPLPPSGPFVDLSLASPNVCGMRPDGSLECWGPDAETAPVGRFQAFDVSPSGTGGCGVRDDGTLACWGTATADAPPAGTYVDVSLGQNWGLAIQSDHQGVCWGGLYSNVPCTPPPSDPFVELTGGRSYTEEACGVRTDGTLACWSVDSQGGGRTAWTTLPTGTFTSVVSVTNEAGCGHRTDGTLECFGRYGDSAGPVPAGAFDSVGAVAGYYSNVGCGVRPDGSLECWGGISR